MDHEEVENRIHQICSILATLKDENGNEIVIDSFHNITSKQYLELCMFLLKQLFRCSFGINEEAQVNNVIYTITEVLECPVKRIRKSDFKTPTAISSKSSCILLLQWLCEVVVSVNHPKKSNDSDVSLDYTILGNDFSDSEQDETQSHSLVPGTPGYTEFKNQVPSNSTDAISVVGISKRSKDPDAELFMKYFHGHIGIGSMEDFHDAMKILNSVEQDCNKELETYVAKDEQMKVHFRELSETVEKEEAQAHELWWKLEQARLQELKKESVWKSLVTEYGQLKQVKLEQEERAQKLALIVSSDDQENSEAYLNFKLKALVKKLKDQEDRHVQIQDKYLEKIPLLNKQIQMLNHMMIRLDVLVPPFWLPPVSVETLNSWVDGAAANSELCLDWIKAEEEARANGTGGSKVSTDTSEDESRILPFTQKDSTSDPSDDGSRILPFTQKDSTSSDPSDDGSRILFTSFVSFSK